MEQRVMETSVMERKVNNLRRTTLAIWACALVAAITPLAHTQTAGADTRIIAP